MMLTLTLMTGQAFYIQTVRFIHSFLEKMGINIDIAHVMCNDWIYRIRHSGIPPRPGKEI